VAPHARVGLSLNALSGQRICYVWSSGAAKIETIGRARMEADRMMRDGAAERHTTPLARLIAHPDVTLRVFHSQ
jgi:6-phosphogluconolactonase